MAPFYVLIVTWVVLRVMGQMGRDRFDTWRKSARGALGVMFIYAGLTHFSTFSADYLAMIPPPLPREPWLISLTGVLEVAGGIGLLIPWLRRRAAWGLLVLLIALFPANIYAALQDIPFQGEPPTPLYIRAPVQLFYLSLLWWSTLYGEPEPDELMAD